MHKYIQMLEFRRILDIFTKLYLLKNRNILVSSNNNYSPHIFDSHEISGFWLSMFGFPDIFENFNNLDCPNI